MGLDDAQDIPAVADVAPQEVEPTTDLGAAGKASMQGDVEADAGADPANDASQAEEPVLPQETKPVGDVPNDPQPHGSNKETGVESGPESGKESAEGGLSPAAKEELERKAEQERIWRDGGPGFLK